MDNFKEQEQKEQQSNKIKPAKKYEVLQLLARSPSLKKEAIGNILDSSRTTVSRIISSMEKDGILAQDGNNINSEFGYAVGIAVGTRHIRTVVLNMSYKPLSRSVLSEKHIFSNSLKEMEFNTKSICPDQDTILFDLECDLPKDDHTSVEREKCLYEDHRTLSEIARLLNIIIADAIDMKMGTETSDAFNLIGIGISFQGSVNKDRMSIDFSPNLNVLTGKRVQQLIYKTQWNLIQELGVAIVVDSTVKSALIAEREELYKTPDLQKYQLRDKPNIGLVYMGTGISFATTFDGKIARGASNYLGELGHIRFPRFGEAGNNVPIECSCKKSNCLEALLRKDVFDADSLSDYWAKTTHAQLENFSIKHPEKYKKLKRYVGYIMHLLVDMLNLDVLLFTGRIFACIPDLENELDTIIGENTKIITCGDCIATKGADWENSASRGIAIEAIASAFESEITWPDIDSRS